MNLSVSSIVAGLIFSAVGLWMFRAGKDKGDTRLIVIAVVLMVYSYFTPNPWYDWGIGAGLCGLAYHMWN